MAIKDRIKEARQRKNFTQEQLASRIGIAKSTLAGYETGIREPSIEIIGKIMYVLDIDANYLWQDEGNFPLQVSYNEMEHIKKYRSLDALGQSHVDTVLDWEIERISAITELQNRAEDQASRIVSLERATRPVYYISYYQRMASAGSGEYLFDDLPTDVIEVLDSPIARQADFVLGVNGRSMEPTYYDGDRVFVQKTDEIPNGCIGVFTRGNDCYIKELGADRLISHNPDKKTFPDIIVDDREVKLVGRVLGKVE